MSAFPLLLAHSMKRVRTLLATMALVLGAFQVVIVVVAGTIQRSGGFEQLTALLPPFARELLGPSVTTFMSFGGIVCLGYFHLVVMSALVALAISVATLPASEVETGFVDLILSRPLARHWMITRTIVMVILSIAIVVGMMVFGTWLGLHAFAPADAVWPKVALIRSLALNLALLMFCWSGVGLTLAARARRRAAAGSATAVIAFASFLLDYVGRLWQPAAALGRLSPFRYFSPYELVIGAHLPVKNVLVLSGIGIAGFVAAYILYWRRDLAR